MIQHFPKPNKHYEGNVIVELDLSNYATKADMKEATRQASVHLRWHNKRIWLA